MMARIAARFRAFGAQLPYVPRALRLVWSSSRGWTLAWGILLVFQGLLPVAIVYLTRALVNSLMAAVASDGTWPTVRPTLVLALAMAGAMLLTEVLRGVTDWIRSTQAEFVRDHIVDLIHEKSTTVDLAFYESPDFYDRLHRARDDAGHRPVALLENAGSLFQNGITLVSMAAVLVPYGFWIPLALLVSTVPAFLAVMRHAVRQHEWRSRVAADERRTWYYEWLMTAGGTAAELRLFDLGGRFRAAYTTLRMRLRREQMDLARRRGIAEVSAAAAAIVVTGGCLAWMVWRAMRRAIGLGDLAMFYQAFSQGQKLMRTLLGDLGQVYSNMLFLGNLFDFLDMKPVVLDPPCPAPQPAAIAGRRGVDIRFDRVTFRYPGSENMALNDINLTITAGQIAAIVGTNGAGKSTLFKLLCRFYDPQAGRIEMEGVDLRSLPLRDLRSAIAVLFQDPVHYHFAAAENIALGDPRGTAGPADIEAAARAAGAHEIIARLPLGYDTLLGKWFAGGSELSVGEWQRVSLARAFLRKASLLILDEPTSAMDSWAETEWLGRFRIVAAGRTVIIVTHRFTTAMQADVIHVMQDGRVVESGAHKELLAMDGPYAQSWRAQMRVV